VINRKHCSGCRNNIYNSGFMGAEMCWSRKTGKMEMRVEVPMWQPPPYSQTPRKVPSCYHRGGYAQLTISTWRASNAAVAKKEAHEHGSI
jgi:hypothetical protein